MREPVTDTARRSSGLDDGAEAPDLADLARICFPLLPASTPGPWEPEALKQEWARLRAGARSIPPPVLNEIIGLLADHRHRALREFFQGVATGKDERAIGGSRWTTRNHGRSPGAFLDLILEEASPKPRRETPDPSTCRAMDANEVSSLFGPAGRVAAHLPGYEYREQQAEMARSVAEAFSQGRHLLVEAGTGIGKSLAYLIPAVIWATANKTPVVISTNTKNLQSQLFQKDLPAIGRILGTEFRSALIKGRRNYLCLRKLAYALRHASAELEADEVCSVAGALVWAVSTAAGDISECGLGERPGTQALSAKLTSAVEECRGADCDCRRRCFLHRARRKALAADVVVANHSVVFSEMGMPNPVLPPYDYLILDEAHNIEEAATRWLAVDVSAAALRSVAGRLWRPGRRSQGTGLIPAILRRAESGALGDRSAAAGRIVSHAREIRMALDGLEPATAAFFHELGRLMGAGRERDAKRICAGDRAPAAWEPIETAKNALLSQIERLALALDAVSQALQALTAGTLFDRLDFVPELDGSAAKLRETARNIEFVLTAEAESYVFWVERVSARDGHVRAWGAPVSVASQLAEGLYARKASVVLTSATLSVGGSSAFIRKRLGLDRVDADRLEEMNVGTPFEFERQCAVMVPMFLPEPDDPGRDYASELGTLLAEVFRRTRGRGLALFTSYEMLARATEVLREQLRGESIRVLAQGESGSRESLTETFKQDVSSVLMGTHSFWEGVDVMGESLSCLVVARLPFDVFTDPVIEARCEAVEAEGGSAFKDFSVPNAVIRLRQGFGRLIRHRNDRGIVIVADRRIVSRRYGRWFRDSLPVRAAPFEDQAVFLDAVAGFLADA